MAQSVNVIPDNCLHWYGNKVVSMQGSAWAYNSQYTGIAPTATDSTNSMNVTMNKTTTSMASGFYNTVAKIDVTSFTKFRVEGYDTSGNSNFTSFAGAMATIATGSTHNVIQISKSEYTIVDLDLSELSGEMYLGIIPFAGTSGTGNVVSSIKRMWLE